MEQDLNLTGITAIEDRLQDEVPSVIADLATAGMVLWMLTGDKEETAVNIATSCNLILERTHLYYLTHIEDVAVYAAKLREIYQAIFPDADLQYGYWQAKAAKKHEEKKEGEEALPVPLTSA